MIAAGLDIRRVELMSGPTNLPPGLAARYSVLDLVVAGITMSATVGPPI